MLLSNLSYGQHYNRFEADFSIKQKAIDDTSTLITGTVYFEKGDNRIVYDINFPQDKYWVVKDTFLYEIEGDSLINKRRVFKMVDFSIYNLTLSNNLKNYGLNKTPFQLKNVEKRETRTVMTWVPPEPARDHFGKIDIARKGQKIDGLISYKPNGSILGKQFFRNFKSISGLLFPRKIYQTIITEKGKRKKITSYENIKIDNYEDEKGYRFNLSNRISN